MKELSEVLQKFRSNLNTVKDRTEDKRDEERIRPSFSHPELKR